MSKLKERIRGFGLRRWLFTGVLTVLLLACATCAVGLCLVSHTLDTSAALRFRGNSETRFAQIAAFLPVGKGKTEEDIFAFRQSLEAKFVEQALESPEGGSLYLDAYSGRADVELKSEHGSAQVTAFGVGGDFFYFHPLPLRSGSYIAERDLMDDLVVLDEVLAWRLFGGTDLTGLTVQIGGTPFVISGVVTMESDFASSRAYGSDGCLFLSFSALQKLAEDTSVDCYEIVLPDPITGYGRGIVEETFSPEVCDVVENSSRYTLGHLLDVIGSFGERSMRVNGVIYPYWENAMRLTEDYAAALLVLTALFGLCPAATALVLAIRGLVRGWRYVKEKVPERVEAAVERRREQEYSEFLDNETEGDQTWPS